MSLSSANHENSSGLSGKDMLIYGKWVAIVGAAAATAGYLYYAAQETFNRPGTLFSANQAQAAEVGAIDLTTAWGQLDQTFLKLSSEQMEEIQRVSLAFAAITLADGCNRENLRNEMMQMFLPGNDLFQLGRECFQSDADQWNFTQLVKRLRGVLDAALTSIDDDIATFLIGKIVP